MKQAFYKEGDKVILTPDARIIPYGYRMGKTEKMNEVESESFPLIIDANKSTMHSFIILKKTVGTIVTQTGDEYVSVDGVIYPYYLVRWPIDENAKKTATFCAFTLTPFIEENQVNEIIPLEL